LTFESINHISPKIDSFFDCACDYYSPIQRYIIHHTVVLAVNQQTPSNAIFYFCIFPIPSSSHPPLPILTTTIRIEVDQTSYAYSSTAANSNFIKQIQDTVLAESKSIIFNCIKKIKKKKTMSTNIETVAAAPSSDYVNADNGNGTGNEGVVMNPNRRSQLFFQICDMRTATVALNLLNVIFTVMVALILSLMYIIQGGPFVWQNIGTVLSGGFISAGASALGLWSAMNWHIHGITVTTILFVLILIWRLIKLEWIDILITCLLLYPHVVLTMEMKSGILSSQTFSEEEYVAESGRDFVEMAHDYISPQNSMA
jgi:hypothetical protein